MASTGLINQPIALTQSTDTPQTRTPTTGTAQTATAPVGRPDNLTTSTPVSSVQSSSPTATIAAPMATAPTSAPLTRVSSTGTIPTAPPVGRPDGLAALAPASFASSTGATPATPAQPQAGQAAIPATPAQPATGQPALTGRDNAAYRNATAAAALAKRQAGTPPNVTGDSLQLMGSLDPKTRQPVDPGYYELKQRLLSTLTPQQLKADMAAFRSDQARNPNESRTFKEWLQGRIDSYIQGWITPDANDRWRRAGIYTPEQQGLLQEMQSYLAQKQTAQPAYQPPVLPTPTAQPAATTVTGPYYK